MEKAHDFIMDIGSVLTDQDIHQIAQADYGQDVDEYIALLLCIQETGEIPPDFQLMPWEVIMVYVHTEISRANVYALTWCELLTLQAACMQESEKCGGIEEDCAGIVLCAKYLPARFLPGLLHFLDCIAGAIDAKEFVLWDMKCLKLASKIISRYRDQVSAEGCKKDIALLPDVIKRDVNFKSKWHDVLESL